MENSSFCRKSSKIAEISYHNIDPGFLQICRIIKGSLTELSEFCEHFLVVVKAFDDL
jgi:hypothetical protein